MHWNLTVSAAVLLNVIFPGVVLRLFCSFTPFGIQERWNRVLRMNLRVALFFAVLRPEP